MEKNETSPSANTIEQTIDKVLKTTDLSAPLKLASRLADVLNVVLDLKFNLAAMAASRRGHHETMEALFTLRESLSDRPLGDYKGEPAPQGTLERGLGGSWRIEGLMDEGQVVTLGAGFQFEVLVGDRWIKTSAVAAGSFKQDVPTTAGVAFYEGQPARFIPNIRRGVF